MSARVAGCLWDKLWEDYSRRVSYARVYEQMITRAGGTVANDHIAFRSLRINSNGTDLGIVYLERVALALGYEAAGEYTFPDQKLYARHYRHPAQDRFDLPKLFISELLVDALPESTARLIAQTVAEAYFPRLRDWSAEPSDVECEQAADRLLGTFTRPWPAPPQSVVEAVNGVTQYGAWVLLHGYAVNHFTGYVNRQNTPRYPDIESTALGLAALGVPMKDEIEGSRGSGLRQTATRAVSELVSVRDDARALVEIPWTYAYYEIAERNPVEAAPGRTALFEAFLGPQASNLFEMTRKLPFD
ncbi:MAG: DUF1338 domain-containing protein [Gemmatimonadaceae bacterium]|nr:DUF1338 domain-containing protein [Gloeobacterales cyanobacterium ES-bin-141]